MAGFGRRYTPARPARSPRHIGWGLGLGQLPDFYHFSAITGAANFYHFRANIAQNFYRPRPSFYRPVLPTRANSRAAQRATPRIPPKLSSNTASLVQRHGLATQLRVALLARLLPLAHDLLVRARVATATPAQPASQETDLWSQDASQVTDLWSLDGSQVES